MSHEVPDEATDAVSVVSRRFTPLTVAALVLLVLVVVLIAMSLTLPWWVLFENGSMWSWYLATSCRSGVCQNYQATPTLSAVFGLTYAIVLGSLAALLLALGFFVASVTRPKIGVVATAAGSVGCALLVAAPLYLYFALPGAITSSGYPVPIEAFFGSTTMSGAGGGSYSWTGAAGWFFAWLVVPLSVAATIAAHRSSKHRATEERAFESLRSLEPHTADVPPPMEPEFDVPPEPVTARFCPVCGARYPESEEFCPKDSERLKDLVL